MLKWLKNQDTGKSINFYQMFLLEFVLDWYNQNLYTPVICYFTNG